MCSLENYKEKFIEFMISSDVLTFGDFTTKSGRKTPYFINTGNYNTAEQIDKLGYFYAKSIQENFGPLDSNSPAFDILFGPAYKGIPLCVATAQKLISLYDFNLGILFNRKEAKDHGEQGTLIGKPLKDGDKVLIIEDVTTSGASIRETVPLLKSNANIELTGLVVSVNRMEKGTTEKNALIQLSEEYGMKTTSIVNIQEIISYLHNNEINGKIYINDEKKAKIEEYLEKYGAIN